MFSRITNYLKDTRIELRKVNWPTRAQTAQFTAMVVLISLIVAAALGAFDFIFTRILLFSL